MKTYTTQYNIPPLCESSIQYFNNVITLTKYIQTMLNISENSVSYIPFKNADSYEKAKEYIIAISNMALITSNFKYKKGASFPNVYIKKVEGVIDYRLFTKNEIKDSNSDYYKILKDGLFYREVLKNAVMMQYLTKIIDIKLSVGTGDSFTVETYTGTPPGDHGGTIPVTGDIKTQIGTEIRPES